MNAMSVPLYTKQANTTQWAQCKTNTTNATKLPQNTQKVKVIKSLPNASLSGISSLVSNV